MFFCDAFKKKEKKEEKKKKRPKSKRAEKMMKMERAKKQLSTTGPKGQRGESESFQDNFFRITFGAEITYLLLGMLRGQAQG